MESAFDDVTKMMQAGAWLIAKIAFIYILLPEIVAIVVLGGVLKVRGDIFKILMIGITLICAYLFVRFGMHQIVMESVKISNTN
ncbi:hypothetical protein COLU111180_04170 [Cohnella lubricantis]|nr:hypothetical protein [Cohnella lubricantis]